MDSIEKYLGHKNQSFYCKDNTEKNELTVEIKNWIGQPSSGKKLKELEKIAKNEYVYLKDLYKKYNGIQFQINKNTAGLVVTPINELNELNNEWKKSFEYLDVSELYEYQKGGIAFATIHQSGNYFIIYNGNVYYGDHDGGDDTVWGNTLNDFFEKALSDPAKFLYDVGCYTRYSDGKTDIQYIPEKYNHE